MHPPVLLHCFALPELEKKEEKGDQAGHAYVCYYFHSSLNFSLDHLAWFIMRPVRLDLSAESAAIQQCFSLTTNQRTMLSTQ
jgi:hypothetical protein